MQPTTPDQEDRVIDADPSEAEAPVVAAGPFERVPQELRAALERRGFAGLTAVQEAMLAEDVGARDLRITSQTGSGKTVALGLALADVLRAPDAELDGPLVLVIAPTRELAQQVSKELRWLYADLRHVEVECVTGGTPITGERRRLARVPRVLVGTPGRLLDHIENGALDVGDVQRLVLDEADQMLDLGFRDELESILRSIPETRRTHLVSATFSNEVSDLAERYQQDPVHIEGTRLGEANADIEHVGYVVHGRQRHGVLVNILLLAGQKRTLIFVRTRMNAAQIAEKLAKDGFAAQPLSGDLPQSQRTRTLDAFRRGQIMTLVATDVAARGLDIPDVETVVHHSPPFDTDTYTHRSGRTGRAGKKGTSILLASRTQMRRLEATLAHGGVGVRWADAPSAHEVTLALRGHARARVEEIVETAVTRAAEKTGESQHEDRLDFARSLLLGRDPEEVVAALAAAAMPRPPRRPIEIERPEGKKERRDRREARAGEYRERDGRGPHKRASRGKDGPFALFELSWGTRHGASPARVLAHICRRAGCDRRVFGNIHIGSASTNIEVSEDFARDFEERTREADPRDPQLRIRRARGSTQPGRAHRGGPGRRDSYDKPSYDKKPYDKKPYGKKRYNDKRHEDRRRDDRRYDDKRGSGRRRDDDAKPWQKTPSAKPRRHPAKPGTGGSKHYGEKRYSDKRSERSSDSNGHSSDRLMARPKYKSWSANGDAGGSGGGAPRRGRKSFGRGRPRG